MSPNFREVSAKTNPRKCEREKLESNMIGFLSII